MKTTIPVNNAPDVREPFWAMSIMLISSIKLIPVGFLIVSGIIFAKTR